MHIRISKEVTDLELLTIFYTNLFNLEVLGSFDDHEGYDGVMLGYPEDDWHLEFTVNTEKAAKEQTSTSEAIVFYYDQEEAFDDMLQKLQDYKIEPYLHENPYWNRNGVTINDPEGNQIILVNGKWK